ncbi:MAG: sigma-70 family RNA polymerase sigma factor [Burkholderiales bacterium]|nr:sigma-70 family RNA polymerase sigma factor [Gemmatimonadaceae bacterium]MCU0870524.1 sigma-70 family RNA polymerase sigma factor [Burkholderiales bacterium]
MASGADVPATLRETVDAIYRAESRRVLATLIRLLGDFERAEDAMQEAFTAALEQWHTQGVPANPRSWLVSAARYKAIDAMRRRARFDASAHHVADALHQAGDPVPADDETISDDRLRLVFLCCHPALPIDAQLALTLREVCGLTTEAIAAAFLTRPSTVAQRIVRAKQKIRQARIPYELPEPSALPARLDAVLHVIYLVFNEGYRASSGDALVRRDLTAEAIRLARLLLTLLPDPETHGLLGLMLLHDARRETRTTADGDLILLEDQDRARWDRGQIVEGAALVERAMRGRRFGAYTLQGAIAAVHAESPSAAATDWRQIVGLYDVLLRIDPSPVVQLNRAAAIAMLEGPAAGLALITPLLDDAALAEYALAHSAAAELHRRAGDVAAARVAYHRALALTQQGSERRFLLGRLARLEAP